MLNLNRLPTSLRKENTRLNMTTNIQPGQLIKGKVVTIYPNQKAAIQFAGRQVIAKLETALMAKQSYIFQVTAVRDMLQLKKIGEVPNNHKAIGQAILKQFGFPPNRSLQSIVQQLTDQQIPFTIEEGYAMANLLDQFGNGKKNRELIIDMLKKRLPLTESAFKSMQTFHSTSVTLEMRQLLDVIQQKNHKNPLFASLQQQLVAFIAEPNASSAATPLAEFLNNNQQAFLHRLRSDMKQIMTDPNRSIRQTGELIKYVNQLLQQQITISVNEQNFFQALINRLRETIFQETRQTGLQQNVRTHPIFHKIWSGLSSDDKHTVQKWFGNTQSHESSKQVFAILERVVNQQLLGNEQNLLRQLLLHLDVTNASGLPVKDRFLHLMKHFIYTGGLLDEARIAQSHGTFPHLGSEQQQHLSLKQQLLFLNQQSHDAGGEPVQRLMQTLTGLQLNMTSNDPLIAQQNLYIPGGKFGLAEDIRIQFEGKQNGDNTEIDSDYCRILFHLHLAKIGETYIALTIQKRVINMTVYNDTPQAKPLINHFTPFLKEKIEALDYQLSAITHKSMGETNDRIFGANIRANKRKSTNAGSINEGIDFRI